MTLSNTCFTALYSLLAHRNTIAASFLARRIIARQYMLLALINTFLAGLDTFLANCHGATALSSTLIGKPTPTHIYQPLANINALFTYLNTGSAALRQFLTYMLHNSLFFYARTLRQAGRTDIQYW